MNQSASWDVVRSLDGEVMNRLIAVHVGKLERVHPQPVGALRRLAQRLVKAEVLTRHEVAQLLHAQLLSTRPEQPACQDGLLQIRTRSQGDFWVDRDPVAPSTLRCPLQERAARYEPYVPCRHARGARGLPEHDWPVDVGDTEKRWQDAARPYVAEDGAEPPPCQILGEFALANVRWPDPIPGDLVTAARTPDTSSGLKFVVDRLNFLRLSGRLSLSELTGLVELRLLVTEPGWLPCKGAEGRTDSACPLQARGRLGDRTTPCVEGLNEGHRQRDGDAAEAKLVQRDGTPLPVSWRSAADQPGGPEDPVLQQQLRPCYLVGLYLSWIVPMSLTALIRQEQDQARG